MIPGAQRLSERVWRVALPGQRPFVLKLAAEGAPLRGEVRYLRWLSERGCPVPTVLAAPEDDDPGWLALEWCEGQSLDVALQGASPRRRAALGYRLVTAQAQIEHAFEPFTAQLRRDPSTWHARRKALVDQVERWVDAAPAALEWLIGRRLSSDVHAALDCCLQVALEAETTVGSLDYHASNVIVGRRRLAVLDWASVGTDWPAQRLVQYATATGSGRPEGNFASALTPAVVRAHANKVAERSGKSAADVAATVDAHEVLLMVIAAQQLKMVAEGDAEPERVAGWTNVEARRERLVDLLSRRLCATGTAAELRWLLKSAR